MTTFERLVTAHHEAGHVAALLSFDIGFEFVSVLADPAPGGRPGVVLTLAHRATPKQQAAYCLSGPVAEGKFSGDTVTAVFATSGRTDHEMAIAALRRDNTCSFGEALHCAETIVATEWRRISKLARALVLVETLDAAEVRRVLRPGSSPARARPPADQRWSPPGEVQRLLRTRPLTHRLGRGQRAGAA